MFFLFSIATNFIKSSRVSLSLSTSLSLLLQVLAESNHICKKTFPLCVALHGFVDNHELNDIKCHPVHRTTLLCVCLLLFFWLILERFFVSSSSLGDCNKKSTQLLLRLSHF